MRTHTAEDIEADLDMLYRYEFEGLTTYALASKVGLSQSQVSRRLARARRYRAERDMRYRAEEQGSDGLDRYDYPYMGLDAPGIKSSGYAACGAEGWANRDVGTWHVGGQVRSLKVGTITTDATGPTSYTPDPNLKGGVG